ncbi:hypothetical protein [Streptomyces sp. NPDC056707]|uniref:hypothetical protein n=1 Tax=Streptomyces sp. NPDC056707 TaxID=3345919 RepID=UPI0036C6BC2B
MNSENPNADHFLGEFQELEHGRPDGPSLRAAVRDHADPDELRLVEYLRSGTILAATASPVHDILSPGRELIDGLHLLTDGQWFWYSDLAHYVEQYHVALDERFVQHAQGRNWAAPPLTHAELRQIEETLFDDDSA